MRVIRKQCELGERSDEEAVSSGSWKKFSEVEDHCNIQEERLDEANDSQEERLDDDTHWEVYRTQLLTSQLALMMEYCHDHENEVQYTRRGGCAVEQSLTYFVRMERSGNR